MRFEVVLVLVLSITKIIIDPEQNDPGQNTQLKLKKIPSKKQYEQIIKLRKRCQYDTTSFQAKLLLLGGNIETNPGIDC